MPKPLAFLRYALLSVVAQVVICPAIWILALLLTPMLDRVFEGMVYFYWPLIILVATILGSSGESGMIAVPILGILIGMLAYGAIAGLLISILKRKLSN